MLMNGILSVSRNKVFGGGEIDFWVEVEAQFKTEKEAEKFTIAIEELYAQMNKED